MATYEVQYKCYLCKLYPNLPFVRYKYRRSGSVFWEKQRRTYIDQFAFEHWKNEYYNDNINEIATYDRVRIMRDILDKEYNGDLRNYMKAMVEFEITNDLIDKEDDNTREISLSFVTDGWQRISIKLKEISKNRVRKQAIIAH